MLLLGTIVSAAAFAAVFSMQGSDEPDSIIDTVGAIVQDATEVPENNALNALDPRDPIPVPDGPPQLAAPGDAPNDADDPGAIEVAVAPGESSPGAVAALSTVLHPTPFWVNALSSNSTFNGRPLTAGDVVTAYDSFNVLIGHYEVNDDGRYGLMPLYMNDTSTAIDEGAEPGETITFRINGYVAEVNGPDEPVWTANGDVLVLDLAASSSTASE